MPDVPSIDDYRRFNQRLSDLLAAMRAELDLKEVVLIVRAEDGNHVMHYGTPGEVLALLTGAMDVLFTKQVATPEEVEQIKAQSRGDH